MGSGDDLTTQALEPLLGERPLQAQPLVLSTASHALEWADTGAPDGAVVVAANQIAPRGRAGAPWKLTPDRGLSFALVLRPQLEAEREGFLYTLVLTALADVSGPDVAIAWPDEVRSAAGALLAAADLQIRLGREGVKFAVVTFLLPEAKPPRGELLLRVVEAVEARLAGPQEVAFEDHRNICATVGRHVRMKLMGGRARLEGRSLDLDEDGALVVEKASGMRVAVRPQDVSAIDVA
ncbi:MAG: hypothetical protein H0W96_12555 [Solirubrobacterales bacterium]|nr:hypothetical protein [Solirubrobacterales bacterium]